MDSCEPRSLENIAQKINYQSLNICRMFGAPSILLNGNGRELVVIIKSQQNESIQNVIYFVKSGVTELRVM